MKIAIVAAAELPIPAINGGATETLMTHLINLNEKKGKLLIDIYCYNQSKLNESISQYKNTKFFIYNGDTLLDKIGFTLHRIIRRLSNRRLNLNTKFCDFCIEHMKKNDYDYIIVEGNVFQVIQISNKINSKIVYHAHTDVLNIDTPNSKEIVNRCDKIITVSEFIKKRIMEIDPMAEEKTFVLKNCIDHSIFKKYDNNSFKKDFLSLNKLKEDTFIILFCGRVEPNKGIAQLVDSLRYLDENYILLVIGSSWYGKNKKTQFINKLEKNANAYKNRIFFTGYLPQKKLPDYYNIADISVFPSISNEAAGLVIIESLACGVPVIVTNKGGMTEYMNNSVGYIIDTNNNND